MGDRVPQGIAGWRVLVSIVALVAGLASAAEPAELEEVAQTLGISDEIETLRAGQVVIHTYKKTPDRQIGLLAVAKIAAPTDRVREMIQSGEIFKINRVVLKSGALSSPPAKSDFAKLVLPDDELRRFAKAKAGDDVNLSKSEIATLKAVAPKGLPAVMDAYRDLLAARAQAYATQGIAGVASYARGDGYETPVAKDLASALAAEKAIRRFAPVFYDYLLKPPANKPPGLSSQLYWELEEIQGRPTVTLAELTVMDHPSFDTLAQRQFYASQTFNALQVLVGAFPTQGGTILIYSNRTITDQVDIAFGASAARRIGSNLMKGEIEALFHDINEALAKKK